MKLRFFFGLVLLLTTPVFADSVLLTWSVPPKNTIKEYSLTFGSDSGLSVTMNVGYTTNYVVNTIIPGQTYWFQVTPLGANKEYGKPSKMVYFKIPVKVEDTRLPEPKLTVQRFIAR